MLDNAPVLRQLFSSPDDPHINMKTATIPPMSRAMPSGTGRVIRLSSLPELGSDMHMQDDFGNIAEDALQCMALALYEEHKDQPQESSVVAIEAVFCLDDAMSWLDCMTFPPLTEAHNPKVCRRSHR